MIVEDHPVADPLTGLPPAREGMQVDALVLQRAPQPFNEDVVEEAAASIHRDAYPGLLQLLCPRPRRELGGLNQSSQHGFCRSVPGIGQVLQRVFSSQASCVVGR